MATLNEGRYQKDPEVILPNGQRGKVVGGPGPVASMVKVKHSDGGYHLETHTNDKLVRAED